MVLGKQELNESKAIVEIPKELSKLNKLIALIGETLLNKQLKQARQESEKLKQTVKARVKE